MKKKLQENEGERLNALQQYNILNSLPEKSFDDITYLASYICEVPIALITLVDDKRQWFKSKVGFEVSETSRDISFCAHAIHQSKPFVVKDATKDERFANNPLVLSNPHIRFYAGSPIVNSKGYALGTVCVIDHEPRELTTSQTEALQALSRQVMVLLEMRHTTQKFVQTNEALHKAEQYFHLFTHASDAIIVFDSETGNILDANKRACELYDISQSLFIGKDFKSLFQDSTEANEYFDDLQNKGLIEDFETIHLCSNGTLINLLISSSIIEYQGRKAVLNIEHDISERKRAEKHLLETEEQVRRLVEGVKDYAIFMLDTEGRVNTWNTGAERIKGYQSEEIIGEHFSRFYTDEDVRAGKVKKIFSTAISEGQFQEEGLRVRKDGSRFWAHVSITAIRDEKGQLIGFAKITRDITERKRNEEELKRAFSEVERLKNQLQSDNMYLREEILADHNFGEIIGTSDELKQAMHKVQQVAATDTTVLITGETGTGKELIARAIHNASLRKKRPMVKVNCATLPANLIESELFGHEKGAYTGAASTRIGRFELADNATIFLDEIGELPLDLQSKLLRVLQEGEFERLGSSRTIKANVRVIAATNRDLLAECDKGNFRSDLYYRLHIFPINVPSLRERKEDIPLLVSAFIERENKRLGKSIKTISRETMKVLQNYPWYGNIRELQSVIERAAIVTQGSKLQLADRPGAREDKDSPKNESTTASTNPLIPTNGDFTTLEDMERRYILSVLEKTHWRIHGQNGAAEILDINPNTLRSRLQKLGVKRPI